MKVLYTTNLPAPYRIHFFNELNKRCDLTVWYYQPKGMKDISWKFNGEEIEYSYKILPEIKLTDHIRFNYTLYREIKALDVDVIVLGAFSLFGDIVMTLGQRSRGIPMIMNLDGSFISKNPLKEWVKKRLIASCDYYLASGRHMKKIFQHYGVLEDFISEYKFSSLYKRDIIQVPIKQEEKLELRKKLDISVKGKLFISVGRLVPSKGFERLLDMAQKFTHEECHFLIVGSGALKDSLYDEMKRREISNVTIRDYPGWEKILDYYRAADAFCFFSRRDSWGLVINEALANGLPVISYDQVGAVWDLIKRAENGYIIHEDDVTSYERGLRLMIESNLKDMSRKSIDIIQEYNIENMVDIHIEVLEKVRKR